MPSTVTKYLHIVRVLRILSPSVLSIAAQEYEAVNFTSFQSFNSDAHGRATFSCSPRFIMTRMKKISHVINRTAITRQGFNEPALANAVVQQAVVRNLASRFTRHPCRLLRRLQSLLAETLQAPITIIPKATSTQLSTTLQALLHTPNTPATINMGYRSERDKDGNKIPREHSGKPRRHRDDHLDFSKRTDTSLYPPSSSVFSHAQPFHLPNTGNTSNLGTAPMVAQSGPRSTPSDRPHHPLPTIQETARPSRPVTSREDCRAAKIPPPVKTPMSVGYTGSSAAPMGTSCPLLPLAGTRDPFTDSHRVKGTRTATRDPFSHPPNVTGMRGSWGAAVQDPFIDPPATRHSSSTATRVTTTSKHDASRRMPGVFLEPDLQHSSARSAVLSAATLHAPIPTRPHTRRPVIPSIHPFKRSNDSSARSEASSNTSKGSSSRYPPPIPAHLNPLPPRSSASSRSSPSVSKQSDASQTKSGSSLGQTMSSLQASRSSSSSPLPAPSTSSPLPPCSPHPPPSQFSSALLELERNPWTSAPSTPIVRRSSLKGATPVCEQQRTFGFEDADEVQTYDKHDAPRILGK